MSPALLSMIAPLIASGPPQPGSTPPQTDGNQPQTTTTTQGSSQTGSAQTGSDSSNPSKPTKVESPLSREDSFVSRFRKEVGSYPKMDYHDMPMKDGSKQTMLVYKVGDHLFAPAIHDHDWAFGDTSKLAQIPRSFDPSQGDPKSVPVDNVVPVDSNTAKPLASPNQGPGQPVQGPQQPVQGPVQPTQDYVEGAPIGTTTQGGAPQGAITAPAPSPTSQGSTAPLDSQNSGVIPTTNSNVNTGQLGGQMVNSPMLDVPGGGGVVMNNGDPASTGAADSNNSSNGVSAQKAALDHWAKGSGADEAAAKANALRQEAAGVIPEHVSKSFGGPGMWATGALALLAGNQAGHILSGAYQGVQQVQAYKQELANHVAQLKIAGLNNEAAALEKQIPAMVNEYYRKGQGLNNAVANDQKATNEQDKLQLGEDAIQGKLSIQQWKELSQIAPEGRSAYAQNVLHITDPTTLDGIARANSKDVLRYAQAGNQDAQAGLAKEKTTDISEKRPYTEALMAAKTDATKFQGQLSQARANVQKITADWLPKVQQAKINNMAAETDKATADAAKARAQAFNPDGSIRQGAITPTTLASLQTRFVTAADKADKEIIEKTHLYNSIKAQYDANQKIINEPVKDPLALDGAAQLRNKAQQAQPKLQTQLDQLNAEMAGLNFLSQKSKTNLAQINAQAGQGQQKPAGNDEAAYRDRMAKALPKLSPQDQAAAIAAFKTKFHKDY